VIALRLRTKLGIAAISAILRELLVGIGIIVIIYLVSAELLKPLAVTQHDKMKQKEK
jgi:hypothetical protein